MNISVKEYRDKGGTGGVVVRVKKKTIGTDLYVSSAATSLKIEFLDEQNDHMIQDPITPIFALAKVYSQSDGQNFVLGREKLVGDYSYETVDV